MRANQETEEQLMRFIKFLELRHGPYEIGLLTEIQHFLTLRDEHNKSKGEVKFKGPHIQPMSNAAKRMIIGEFIKKEAEDSIVTK